MPRSPAQLALYAHRRANALCVDCGADLKPLIAWGKPRCPECHESALDRSRRYNATEAGQARGRLHMRRVYAERRAAGQCVTCGEPAAPFARCETHRADHCAWNARYYDAKEAARAG